MKKIAPLALLATLAAGCAVGAETASATAGSPPPASPPPASPTPASPTPAPGAKATLPPPGMVGAADARRLVAAGARVVDVRTPEEFAQGHVPGAANIPFEQVGARHAEIGPPSAPVLLYCRSGRRSGIAARALVEKGFTAVYDMKSLDAWKASSPAGGTGE